MRALDNGDAILRLEWLCGGRHYLKNAMKLLTLCRLALSEQRRSFGLRFLAVSEIER